MSRNFGPAAALGMLSLLAGNALATQTVVVTWNQAALEEVRRGRLGPPVVARALAVAHTCMYDAWTAYDARAIGAVYTPPRRPTTEFTDANKAKAVSFAAYRCLSNLFPDVAGRLNAQMRQLGYDPNDVSTNLATPQGIGNVAAAAVIANRRNDGSNQYGDLAAGAYSDYTGYASVNPPMPFCLPATPGVCNTATANIYRWQPLINDRGAVQTFVAPHWERVRPFALKSAYDYDTRPEVAAGPAYLQSAARYQADVDQILSISSTLSPQQKLIVEYWADGPDSELPPGHWSLFAQHVSRRDLHNIDKDVKMFFAMQNASLDAGIVAWHLKRKYDGVRPITSVRNLRRGQQVLAWGGPGRPNQVIDAGKWSPYNPGSNLTPSFPGWVSGHSTFSAASATVLRAFTGSDHFGFSTTVQPNFGRVELGVPPVSTTLSYPTFTAAVNDAGISRLYAGIHFADDNTVGQTVGNLAGQEAWAKAKFLFDGGLAAAGASSAYAPSAMRVSWQHTVEPLSNRGMLVGVSTTSSNSYVVSASYAGVPLQRIGWVNGPWGDNRAEMWGTVGAPVGTGTVTLQMSNFNDVVAGAMNFSGVHQAAPLGTLSWAANSTSSACVQLANEPAPLVASVLAVNSDAGSVSPGAGQTLRWQADSDPLNFLFGAWDIVGTGMVGAGTPAGNVCQYLARGRNWGMLAVPLKPAVTP